MTRSEKRSAQAERARFLEEAMPHMDRIYRMAVSLARDGSRAEDLVQETYREAWQSFHGYAPGSDCRAWLFRILFRAWNRDLRRSYRMQPVEIGSVGERELSVEPDIQRRVEGQDVLKVLHSLPEHYQTVLVLADVEEFSYREIAAILDLPLGTVMSRLNRARGLFRRKFAGESEDSRSA